jgi:hypothetical protein
MLYEWGSFTIDIGWLTHLILTVIDEQDMKSNF